MDSLAGIKNILRKIVTSFRFIKKGIFKPKEFTWFIPYPNWNAASAAAEGYDSKSILENCKASLSQVRDGLYKYERDSVLFDEIQYSWGLLAGLQKAAINNSGKLCVMDFGGSLGSSYYQNKDFLEGVKELTWCIIEQPGFVDCGKENFQTENLLFYHTIEECMREQTPTVLILSGVLPYLEFPYQWIEKFLALDLGMIIIDRMGFSNSKNDFVCLQNVPETIYKASYPCWFFNKTQFLKIFKNKYKNIILFNSGYTSPVLIEGSKVFWEGMIIYK